MYNYTNKQDLASLACQLRDKATRRQQVKIVTFCLVTGLLQVKGGTLMVWCARVKDNSGDPLRGFSPLFDELMEKPSVVAHCWQQMLEDLVHGKNDSHLGAGCWNREELNDFVNYCRKVGVKL